MKTAARSVAGRLKPTLRCSGGTGVLIEAQQIIGEAHAQERALGGVEVLHTEAVCLQVVLEFLDVLLATGTLVVVAPKFRSVALAVGDEDPQGVAIHVDEPTPDRTLPSKA